MLQVVQIERIAGDGVIGELIIVKNAHAGIQ